MRRQLFGEAEVIVADSERHGGELAATELAGQLRAQVARTGSAAVILATGNSQVAFIEALRVRTDVPWSQTTIFHMDEYIGLSADHPANFRRYIRDELTDRVRPAAFHELNGDATDLDEEMRRYGRLLEAAAPVVCVLGIGENGHLAFNDPPADFSAAEPLHRVRLADTARQQQVNEGHFAVLSDVPLYAMTLTIPTLLKPGRVLAIVPERRKAEVVRTALQGPISPECPASILRQTHGVTIYLDPDSSSLLELDGSMVATVAESGAV